MQRMVRFCLALLTLLLLSACAPPGSVTPWPTYTPIATYTPVVQAPASSDDAPAAAQPAAASQPTAAPAAEAVDAAPTSTEAPAAGATASPAPLNAAAPAQPTPVGLSPAEIGRTDPRRVEVLARVNEWRLSVGAWPLTLNPTLMELAQGQADYLASRGTAIPDDVHLGPDGSQPFDRLRHAGWPTYNNSQQIEASEVVYIGADAETAVGWWYNSDLHKRTIENPSLREAGIGIANHKWGTIFVILLASQPNRLTALYEPISQQLYIAPETSKYARKGDFITLPTRMQIVGLPDSPVDPNAWVEYNLTADPPAGLQYFTIVLSDGAHESRIEINTTIDVAWLPESYPQDGVLTGIPTETLRSAADRAHQQIAEQRAAGEIDAFNLGVVYYYDRLALINNSTRPIDLRGLALRAPNGYQIPIDNWAAFMNPRTSLAAFPPGHCLVVYPAEIDYPGPPSGCAFAESAINVVQDQVFWRADFEIRRNGQPLVTCQANVGLCAAEVPWGQ